MMTMADAVKTLEGLYPKTYTAATLTITTYHDGGKTAKCSLYVDGLKHHEGHTWEAAFDALAAAERCNEELYELAA